MAGTQAHRAPGSDVTEWHAEAGLERLAKEQAALRSQQELRKLADEQGALHRVATLVARGIAPESVFAAVADEVNALFDSDTSAIVRFEAGDTVTVMGAHGGPYEPGARVPLDTARAVASVRETARSARFERGDPAADGRPGAVPADGPRSVLATPIVVDGELWGAITVASLDRSLPAAMEQRLADFTELAATAISNTQAREDVRQLFAEQAALRRVATLVAREAPRVEVFNAIAQELADLLGAEEMRMLRYESDREAVFVASSGSLDAFTVGTRVPLDGDNVASLVLRTGRQARIDDYRGARGPIAEGVRAAGIQAVVGTPILVEGRVWGAMLAATGSDESLPLFTEFRLGQFTELMATAIANAESRDEVSRLADEQAALRRVAMLVARGASPGAVFDAVAAEAEGLLDADQVVLSRYEPGDEITFVASSGPGTERLSLGTRASHAGDESAAAAVWRTKRPARIDHIAAAPDAVPTLDRKLGAHTSVGAPLVVEGRLWGVITANWTGEESPPGDTAERLGRFAQLLETAIANADSREHLDASRARLLTEADNARRRLVRDLHDGAQQRFVHTIVILRLAQRELTDGDEKLASLIGEALLEAEQGNADLRELAHGILPPVLAGGGLSAGVRALVTRLELPVDIEIPSERFPEEIEASAYFIVAEALTNVVKHAHAERAEVRASVQDGLLHLEVRDDGIGGADATGHGLTGLRDRAAALGGRLELATPAGGGTDLRATLPLPGGRWLDARS